MPQLKGVIKTPTGEPLGGATITLTSLHNRAGILKGVFSHVTTQSGEYDFSVLPGVYSVRLTQSAQRLSEIGVIRVYEDSPDGSLNDFLGATDIDLRPEALRKLEELTRKAQESAQKAEACASEATKAEAQVSQLAPEVQRNAARAEQAVKDAGKIIDKAIEELTETTPRIEQAAKDVDKIVDKAIDVLRDAAVLRGEAKVSAGAAADSERDAQQHASNAEKSLEETRRLAKEAQDNVASWTAQAVREMRENPLTVIPDESSVPEHPLGLFLILADASKGGGPQIYLYTGEKRYWFASTEDTTE